MIFKLEKNTTTSGLYIYIYMSIYEIIYIYIFRRISLFVSGSFRLEFSNGVFLGHQKVVTWRSKHRSWRGMTGTPKTYGSNTENSGGLTGSKAINFGLIPYFFCWSSFETYFPSYWLFDKDPHNGLLLLYSHIPHKAGYNLSYNP